MNFQGLIIFGGMSMLIYLAAMQDIPAEHFEAAMIEGAGFCRRIWHITIPAIRNIILIMLVFGVMGTFNTLENVMIMTGGGPGGATETMLLYAYKQATTSLDYSYAITMATIVFFMTLILTIIITNAANKIEEN